MAGLGDLFSRGSIGEQLLVWGVLNQVIGALITPGTTELQYLVLEGTTPMVLSPAELATLVNRNFMQHDAAAADAAKAGLDGTQFTRLVDLAGEAPAPGDLAEALRRGLIAESESINGLPSFSDGIRQGNLRDIWAPLMRELAIINPSMDEAIEALVQSQLTEAEARHWYTLAGGNPDAFTWLFDTHGEAPGPAALGEAANRGIIGWDGLGPASLSFEQGVHEGRARNKWEPVYRALAVYHPPPRTVTALLRAGAITDARALELFKAAGLSAADAAAYIADAHHANTRTAKNVTRGDIETLLTDHLISEAQATTMLTDQGYSAADAKLIVTAAGIKKAASQTTSAVNRIKSLYLARKLTRTAAADTLKSLGIEAAQVQSLLAVWDDELAATVKQLTEAQIAGAFAYGILDQEQAQAQLQAIGYGAWDAWVILSVRKKAALPNEPPHDVGPAAIV